jgi:phosphoenolpyruvate-protein phosphotransferase/dihydroxyacetone kinase phosphotransfer subunit
MVGIVIVSHSRSLATAVRDLALQMVPSSTVRLEIAAGIDDPAHPFGTDPLAIFHAIESVYTQEGVVILMDMGSAVLSAEMAIELLNDDRRSQVHLCDAPLIEGTIAAVVQASTGATLREVLAAAQGALSFKSTQLSPPTPTESTVNASPNQQPFQEIYLTIENQLGLHARPAAQFVRSASQFQSDITLENLTLSSGPVNAKSINQVLTLGIRQNHQIRVTAAGLDATEALVTLQELLLTNVSTDEPRWQPLMPVGPLSVGQLLGIAVATGIAIGPAVLQRPPMIELDLHQKDDPQTEWEKLLSAISTACYQIQVLRQKAAVEVGQAEAVIFDAHLLCLSDPVLHEAAKALIFDQHLSAAAAWQTVIEELARTYKNLDDPYLQARSIDITDVGQRVLQLLAGSVNHSFELPEPGILISTELTPSVAAQLDLTKVLGVCTALGSATSHSGILARSLGVPTVMGVGSELLRIENGTTIAIDGETGQVWIQPDAEQLQQLQHRRIEQQQNQQSIALKSAPALTVDGRSVPVLANVSGFADAKAAMAVGVQGVGLLRTEMLYLERKTPPTEDEQFHAYERIAKTMAPHPITIRVLDLGGDKPVPYVYVGPEVNPFLGRRGIRLLLEYPELLMTQFRAILRVSHRHRVKILLPMVSSLGEITAAKQIFATVISDLRLAGIPYDEHVELGIMIEVPAAVTIADQLATQVDFFSIGTNDLSQYVMAADRTNPRVATLADSFAPAVLRMIHQTTQAAKTAGIQVSVCGEFAALPLAVPILLGLGVDELSVNPTAISTVKQAISQLNFTEAQLIAREVLDLDSSLAVQESLKLNLSNG